MFGRVRVLVVVCVAALAVAGLPLSGPAGAAPPSTTPELDVESWASVPGGPWDIAFLPDGPGHPSGTALLTEKATGVVYVRRTNGSTTAISADQGDLYAGGEAGLMGIAVDPDFNQNRRYYTCQDSADGNGAIRDVRVIRWRLNQALTSATREAVIIDSMPVTDGRHSGCRLAFGYEGYLWVTTGDGAIGTTPQDLNSLGGKVLRVDPLTGNGPSNNPFYTTAGANRSKVYSYGHRNVQGLGRRPCTNQMWTAEHGPAFDDEINRIRKGGNYGWNPVPGYNESVPMTDFSLPGKQRRAKWTSGSDTIAISGIGWIRGADWGGWDGELAGATLKDSRLWIFEFSNGSNLLDIDIPAEFSRDFGRLRVPVMGPDGALYVASPGFGAVYRALPQRGRTPGNQDLNGDGYDDLVVGGPGEDINGIKNAGGFHVLYGSAAGIRTSGVEQRDQTNLLGAKPQRADRLGSAVAYGDIDGDGITDIVLGTPKEDVKGTKNAGAITVVCGRTAGIEKRSSQTFSQSGSVAGATETADRFGDSVVMGDFNGDGYNDVVAGVPKEDVGGADNAGAITVLYGTNAGLSTEGSVQLTQSDTAGVNESGDRFGKALAAGDFDGDGYDDLAVGAPYEDVGSASNAGEVTILYGSATGFALSQSTTFNQTDTPGDNASGDRFGTALASGDFDGDGRDDLAVGSPRETVGGAPAAGEVTVIFGTANGLSSSGIQLLNQSTSVPGANESQDKFGASLGTGDIDGDNRDDLVVGSPGENNRGRIVVFMGRGSGLGSGEAFSLKGQVPGSAKRGDRMGAAVRVADFNGDGRADVAVGIPGKDVSGKNSAGAIVVLNGSSSGLTRDGRYITQSTAGVPGAASTGDKWGTAL